MITVEVTKDELRVCTLVAMERWLTKWGSQDSDTYSVGKEDGKLEPKLMSEIRSVVAEYAVAKSTNTTWNFPWYPNELHRLRKNMPDVGVNGEVRNVRGVSNAFPVWRKDAGKIIIGTRVLGSDYFTAVEVFGYIKADDVIGVDEYIDVYGNFWRVPAEKMTPIDSLNHLQ